MTASLVIAHGGLVTGDGRTVLEQAWLLIRGEMIAEVIPGPPPARVLETAGSVIDATGKLVIPGVINGHAHGVTLAPLFASCAPGLSHEQVLSNLDTHMREGSTTVLSVDGFATIEDVETIDKLHPVRLRTSTSHSACNLRAAEAADGSGLHPRHRSQTMEGMLERGAVAIGEIGSGHTLGGGGQDYLYIPQAIYRETGYRPSESEARALKYAVVGRLLDRQEFDAAELDRALANCGLSARLSPERAAEIIRATVLPPVGIAQDSLKEAETLARRYGLPVISHHAATSCQVIAAIADRGISSLWISGHCNHPSFLLEEALQHASHLHDHGVIVDISTWGAGWRGMTDAVELQFALLRAGLVDTVSSDYGGGRHDPILEVLDQAVQRGDIDLAGAVALATHNVARAIPLLAPQRGLIAPGMVADLVVVDKHRLSQIDKVIIGGRICVDASEQSGDRGESS